MTPPSRTYLIDGSSYIYRAFYALPHLSTRQGIPTNAVYGFVAMLLKVIREEKPDRLAVVFDAKGPSFRKELYPEYKANRKEMPADLVPQIPLIKEAVKVFNLAAIEKQLRERRGYALLVTDDVVTAHGLSGKQLRFGYDQGSEPHLYFVTIFIAEGGVFSRSKLFLIEAGGKKELGEQEAAQIDYAITNFRH